MNKTRGDHKMLYTLTVNDEFLMLCRAPHVDSVIDDLELQGFNIVDVTWDDTARTVALLVEEA
jgi:hypothetical protein